ncbi:MAG: polyprenyl synthetase family protein [Propionibacteriaceae bacterium]
MVNPPVGVEVAPVAASVLDPASPLSVPFRDAVSRQISRYLEREQRVLDAMGPELDTLQQLAESLLRGGKRLRPAFAVWSYVAAHGLPDDELEALLSAAGSLEMLHVSALVHDDVMDSSDLRRGQPAAHRQFESLHSGSSWLGDAAAFGRAGAILLGDLLLMWSVQMLQRCGLPDTTLARALPILEAMRTEVTCGQYLDVVAQAQPWQPATDGAGGSTGIERALDEASRVVEYKSARDTVQRPCQMGAALGGGDARLHDALGSYGSPLGRAFQYRDDVLGVFGDSEVTGKPSGDDLREGKRTVLVAHAYAHTDDAGRQLMVRHLGDPALDAAGVAALQEVITDSGARDSVEAMIEESYETAMRALEKADLTDEGRRGLTGLAEAAVRRAF